MIERTRHAGLEYADGFRRNLDDSQLRQMVRAFKASQEKRQRQGFAAVPMPLFLAEAMQRFAEKR
jgi:hypothetical protein